MNVCIVVPHYDHLDQFRQFLPRLSSTRLPLIVVDDASPGNICDELEALLDSTSVDAILVRHDENQGKGVAVGTGLRAALAAGYTHALQVDADGQHNVENIAAFVAAAERDPDAVICGAPVYDSSRSGLRYYARFITLFFVWLETLSTEIRDAMCGFRLYPIEKTVAILDSARLGRRMTFDPELLVRSLWAGLRLHYLPVRVAYPEDGRSHFHYFRDNVEISWMHTRLIVGMIVRLPLLLQRKLLGGARRA